MKQVLVVGGGFAGVRLARRLRKHKDISVTLINESPDFRYSPSLYRAATGYKIGIARLPLEWILLDCPNTDLVVGRATKINHQERFVTLENGEKYSYDYGVLALGSVTTFFNIEGLHEHAFGVKSAEEVIELRKHLHEVVARGDKQEQNFVIVGAGPTGVEMAGALGSYLNSMTKKHRAGKNRAQIWLIEAAPRILPQMNERAAKAVHKRLEKLGIKIATSTVVKGENLRSLHTSAGNIETHTVIWTAGAALNPFYDQNAGEFSFSEKHKIKVDEYLQARHKLYVIGDNAATKYSGTALTAVRHGKYAAKDIVARVHKRPRRGKYEGPPAQVVPIGKAWSVLQYRGLVLSGWFVSLIRSAADYIGYSDVLGYYRAITVWAHTDVEENACQTCLNYKAK